MAISDFYCSSAYWQINWQIYSPGRSVSEWQFQIFTVRAHMGRSTGRSTPHLSARHDGMYIVKGKVLCIIQYNFNVSVTSQLAYINTNYTLLDSSSSTHVQVTESTLVTNMKPAIEEDATSGKKNIYKNFIYNEFTFKYAS